MDFRTQAELDAYGQMVANRTESNRKIKRMFNERDLAAVNGKIKESYRLDLTNKEKFDLDNPFFSVKGFRENVVRMAESGRFREANPESAFSAVFRALVNNSANNWYELTPTVYEEIVQIVPSTHAVEPYAPMGRGGMPQRTPPGMPTPEVKIAPPMDIQILNEKYTAISAVPEELIKWDMTGQVQMRLQDLGPNMGQYEDAYVAGKFISPTGGTSFFGDNIPASTTKPSIESSATWPWSTAFLGGGANILSGGYARFNQQTLQDLEYLLFQQKDIMGNRLVVTTDTIYHGGALRFPVGALMNSQWYPVTSAMKVAGTSTVTGIGQQYAENTMKGLYRPVMSRYLPGTAYAIGMAHKGMVMQVASGLEVVQETPNSGASFGQGELRFKAKKYWGSDWIDPRFWGLGDDGTASS